MKGLSCIHTSGSAPQVAGDDTFPAPGDLVALLFVEKERETAANMATRAEGHLSDDDRPSSS